MQKASPQARLLPFSIFLTRHYQGMIFFRPFFFLLLDSFLGSSLPSGFADPSVLLASVPFVAAESAFAGCSLSEAAAVFGLESSAAVGGFATPAAPGAGGCVAAGAVLSPLAAAGAAALSGVAAGVPSVAGADSAAAGAAPPGVTVSTTAVLPAPPPPSCDLLPPFKISMPESLSDSGCKFGRPLLAEAIISS